jgi:hypothetical protein
MTSDEPGMRPNAAAIGSTVVPLLALWSVATAASGLATGFLTGDGWMGSGGAVPGESGSRSAGVRAA